MGRATEITLLDVLETVEEFGAASASLVAWEFMVDDTTIFPLWNDAFGQGLICRSAARPAPGVGEEFFELTERGRARVSVQRRNGRPAA